MTTTTSTTQEPTREWRKAVAAVLGTATLLAVLVIAFALPASRSGVHDVPIGVVASPAQVEHFQTAAKGFKTKVYASETDARTAIAHRQVYGALVLDSPTDVTVLVATAASPAVAALVQATGQHIAAATHRTAHLIDVCGFPDRDPKGIGLAAGALPLALGGWMGAMVIMLLVHTPGRRLIAAAGVAIVGGLSVVGTLQFIIGTFDGNYWATSLAGMFGIAATCFTVLGLRELLGGAGLGVAAVLLILLGNPLSGLASAPEMLPQPWGEIGQLLPPGATGTLLRDVTFFHAYGATHSLITLTCYLVLGLCLYVLGLRRADRGQTEDVDIVEFGTRPRPAAAAQYAGHQPVAGRDRRAPNGQVVPGAVGLQRRPQLPSRREATRTEPLVSVPYMRGRSSTPPEPRTHPLPTPARPRPFAP